MANARLNVKRKKKINRRAYRKITSTINNFSLKENETEKQGEVRMRNLIAAKTNIITAAGL